MSKKGFIDSVKVGSPCSEEWNEMHGTNKIRFCSHCTKHVNNLSEMTRKEAMRLVRASGNNLCIRYIQDPVTNRPLFAEQLLQITRRAPGLAAGVMTASVGLSTLSYAQGGVQPLTAAQPQVVAEKAKGEDRASASGTISGIVVDPQGAVIPNANVSLFSVEAGRSETTSTNDEGSYKFTRLEAGRYRLEWEAPGFKKGVKEVTLSAPETTVADLEMEIGFEIVVEVKADIDMEAGVMGAMAVVAYDLPLSRAVADEDLDLVRELLVKGADPNGKDKNYDNMTPLFVAVETGNIEIVELLLNFGAKVNRRDKQKQTPLMRLDDDATPELVEMLVRHGAKVNLIDNEGYSALIMAAGSADHQVLKALVDADADVEQKTKEGRTALMYAAEANDLEGVRVLLVAGASVNTRDKEGDSAWDLATNREVEALLERYGAATREKKGNESASEEP